MNEFYEIHSNAQSSDRLVTTAAHKILFVMSSHLFAEALNVLMSESGKSRYENCFSSIGKFQTSLATAPPPDLIVLATISEAEMADVVGKIRLLRQAIPQTKWLLLSERLWPDQLLEALSIGIDGFLLQDVSAETLRRSIELILLDQTVFPRDFVQALGASRLVRRDSLANTEFGQRELSSAQAPVAAASVDQATDTLVQTALMRSVPSSFTARHPIGTTEATNKPEALPFFPGNAVADAGGRPDWPLDHGRSMEISDRERQILDCLVAGHSNKAIARLLNIAEATVKVHIKALLRKMHVSNRTQAAISALHQRDRLKMQATNLVDFVAAKQVLEKMSATEENTRPAAEAVCPM